MKDHAVLYNSSGTLLFTPVWCAGEPAREDAVSTERCRSFTHQRTQMRPHHTAVAPVTLAASSETSGV